MKITVLDAAVLMYAAIKAAEAKEIGWLDADQPLNRFRMRLNEKIDVEQPLVESALFCLRELEDGEVWKHPDGIDFATFVQKIRPWGTTYNSMYSVFEKEKSK